MWKLVFFATSVGTLFLISIGILILNNFRQSRQDENQFSISFNKDEQKETEEEEILESIFSLFDENK